MSNPFSPAAASAMREVADLLRERFGIAASIALHDSPDPQIAAQRVVLEHRITAIDTRLSALHAQLRAGWVPVWALSHIKREDYVGRAAALAGEIEALCAAHGGAGEDRETT